MVIYKSPKEDKQILFMRCLYYDKNNKNYKVNEVQFNY